MENGSSTLPSANESRGFFGTIREHAKPHDAWMLVMEAVGRARAARTRPSAPGRHFADEVASAMCSGPPRRSTASILAPRFPHFPTISQASTMTAEAVEA